MRDRRLGHFQITFDLINDAPDQARLILHGVIVVRAEAMFATGWIAYVGICDAFEPVEPGLLAPTYTAVLVGGKSVEWRKVG